MWRPYFTNLLLLHVCSSLLFALSLFFIFLSLSFNYISPPSQLESIIQLWNLPSTSTTFSLVFHMFHEENSIINAPWPPTITNADCSFSLSLSLTLTVTLSFSVALFQRLQQPNIEKLKWIIVNKKTHMIYVRPYDDGMCCIAKVKYVYSSCLYEVNMLLTNIMAWRHLRAMAQFSNTIKIN